MSKIETLERSAKQQTVQQRKQVQSTVTSQADLIESINLLLESTATLSMELRQAARQTEAMTKRAAETLTASAQQTTQHSEQALTTLTRQIGNEAKGLRRQMRESADAASQITRTLKRRTLLWTFMSGLLTGIVSLTVLAIWQPHLLVMAYQASKAR